MDSTDTDVALGGIVRHLGLPMTLVTLAGLVAVIVLLVAGFRAKARGGATDRIHWWLLATLRTLVLVGVVGYAWACVAHFNDMVLEANRSGLTKGLGDALLGGAFTSLGHLVYPISVALFGSVAVLALGPPRPADRSQSSSTQTLPSAGGTPPTNAARGPAVRE